MHSSLPRQKRLIPISEAAKVLGVSIDTVRRWDKAGLLHSKRPYGKNRYFSLEELENHKLVQPLPISEAAAQLGISSTTLRRLEAKDLIKPKRNNAGERVYDKDLLKSFLDSGYYLRKQIKKEVKVDNNPIEIPALFKKQDNQLNLKPLQRLPELLTATVIFCLLLAIGLTNISIPVVQSPLAFVFSPKMATSAVLSQSAEVIPAAAPKAAPDEVQTMPKLTTTVKLDNKFSTVNIRQNPSARSPKVGEARNGDKFELVSENADWDEIKLASGSTGFISAKYIQKERLNN